MSGLRRLLALPPAERSLVLQAGLAIVVARLLLYTLPFGKVRRFALRLARPVSGETRRTPPERVAWAVHAVGRRIPGGRHCLAQALAAHVLLGRRGVSSRVCIGVARTGPADLAAHAWLESGDGVLLGAAPTGRWIALREGHAR